MEHDFACGTCVVPQLAGHIDDFCRICARQHKTPRKFHLALLENKDRIRPFLAMDDNEKICEYSDRLKIRDVDHVLMTWNHVAENFASIAHGPC